MKKLTPKKTASSRSKTDQVNSADQTDYERLDAMKDADIDFSDIPEVSPEMFAKGIVRKNLKPVPTKTN